MMLTLGTLTDDPEPTKMTADERESARPQQPAATQTNESVSKRIVRDIVTQLETTHGWSVDEHTRCVCALIAERSVVRYVRAGLDKEGAEKIDYWAIDRFRDFTLLTVIAAVVEKARSLSKDPGAREMELAARDVMMSDEIKKGCERMLTDVHGSVPWTPVCDNAFDVWVTDKGAVPAQY